MLAAHVETVEYSGKLLGVETIGPVGRDQRFEIRQEFLCAQNRDRSHFLLRVASEDTQTAGADATGVIGGLAGPALDVPLLGEGLPLL